MSTDWRADLVDRIRAMIVEAEPAVVEDVREGETLDHDAFVALVRAAVAHNRG